MAGFDSYRFYSTMLVLSETVLVLVIESNLYGCYVRSTQELPLNTTKLVRLSESEHEHEHEHEHEYEQDNGPESQSSLATTFPQEPDKLRLQGDLNSKRISRTMSTVDLKLPCFQVAQAT